MRAGKILYRGCVTGVAGDVQVHIYVFYRLAYYASLFHLCMHGSMHVVTAVSLAVQQASVTAVGQSHSY